MGFFSSSESVSEIFYVFLFTALAIEKLENENEYEFSSSGFSIFFFSSFFFVNCQNQKKILLEFECMVGRSREGANFKLDVCSN